MAAGRFQPLYIFLRMLLGLVFALSLTIFRGIDINCGCFSLGTNSRTGMMYSLLRDLPLLALGFWVFLVASNPGIHPDHGKR